MGSKCVSHSNRLLKKPCAAQCFILCCNLYIDCEYKDGRVACKCLTKACKRASQMMEGVEVLNKYIYLILAKCEDFDFGKVSALIELIKEKITEQESALNIGDDMEDNNNDLNKLQEIKQFFRLSCQYVNDLKSSNDKEVAQNFAKVEL